MRTLAMFLAVATLVGATAGAEELTLADAVRTALERSDAVAAAEARAASAAARKRQAEGYRLPRLDLTELYDRTDSPAESFALLLNQERFDMMGFFNSNPNDPEPLTTWMTRFEVTQPVYTGGRLSSRIRQAQLVAEAMRLEAAHARQRAALDAVTAYVGLAKAREYLALLRTARETTARHLELAERYRGQGMLIEAEVLKAKVYLAKMDELVAQAEHGERLALAALNFQLGLDQGTPHELARLPAPPATPGGLDGWIQAALSARRDLEAARRKLAAGRLEERVARAGFLPEVAVVGRYDLYDDRIFGDHGDSTTLMAVARVNLFRGGSDRAAVAAARHDTASFERDIHRFEEGVRLAVRQAYQDLVTARARQATAAAALDAAREELRVREARFAQGLEKMIDLLDAETALREAEVRELVARYDTTLASWRLHFEAGTDLESLIQKTEATR